MPKRFPKFLPSFLCIGGLQAAYIRFLKIRGEPRQIAYGLALGTFIGMTPFMGLHTAMARFLAAVCKWNKFAAVVGVFVTNPLTAPFIYPIAYVVGNAAIGVSHIPHPPEKLLSFKAVADLAWNSPQILVDLSVGGVIIGLPLSIAAYWIALAMVEKYRRNVNPRLKKHRGKGGSSLI
jgi:uncharacterized protein (TIGR03546 family)